MVCILHYYVFFNSVLHAKELERFARKMTPWLIRNDWSIFLKNWADIILDIVWKIRREHTFFFCRKKAYCFSLSYYSFSFLLVFSNHYLSSSEGKERRKENDSLHAHGLFKKATIREKTQPLKSCFFVFFTNLSRWW